MTGNECTEPIKHDTASHKMAAPYVGQVIDLQNDDLDPSTISGPNSIDTQTMVCKRVATAGHSSDPFTHTASRQWPVELSHTHMYAYTRTSADQDTMMVSLLAHQLAHPHHFDPL